MLIISVLHVKSFSTQIALETVLSRVAGMVIISILCLAEHFMTIVTFILDTSVFIHVCAVRIETIVPLFAIQAKIFIMASVQLHVVIKLLFGTENFSTLGTRCRRQLVCSIHTY